jgi:hypothetical protein
MKRIYTQAAAVIVWLGPSRPHSDEVVGVMAQASLVNLEEEKHDRVGNTRSGQRIWQEESFESWFMSLQ